MYITRHSIVARTFVFRTGLRQGCQVFLGTTYIAKREKIPNDNKIYQMATKYTKGP
jgi:hypothetical protein